MTKPRIHLGTAYGPWPLRRRITLPVEQATVHWHVVGRSGSGKSRFLAGLYLSFLARGIPCTLLDPHGDLTRLILNHLIARGYFRDASAYDRLIYLNLPEALRRGRYVPFNVFKTVTSSAAPDVVADNVKQAMWRAWPALADGAAPRFDNFV